MRVADLDELRAKLWSKAQLWSVSIEATPRCNLACVHCLRLHGHGDRLSYADICAVFDEISDLGCLNVVLTGGEPLLREDSLDLIAYAWRKRMATSILTNGTLITAEWAQRARQRHVASVQVSIYAMSAAIHDGITGVQGSLQRSLLGIDNGLAAGIYVSVATPVMHANAGQIAAISAFFAGRGVACRYGPVLFPKNNGDTAPLALMATAQQLEDALPELSMPPCAAEEQGRAVMSPALCPAGVERLGIGADGAIYPCDGLRVELGNARTHRIGDIWSQSAVLAEIRSAQRRFPAACSGCSARPSCTWCPGLSLSVMGDMHVPNAQDCRRTRLGRPPQSEDAPGWSIPPALQLV